MCVCVCVCVCARAHSCHCLCYENHTLILLKNRVVVGVLEKVQVLVHDVLHHIFLFHIYTKANNALNRKTFINVPRVISISFDLLASILTPAITIIHFVSIDFNFEHYFWCNVYHGARKFITFREVIFPLPTLHNN